MQTTEGQRSEGQRTEVRGTSSFIGEAQQRVLSNPKSEIRTVRSKK
jgi:hypothetical protein